MSDVWPGVSLRAEYMRPVDSRTECRCSRIQLDASQHMTEHISPGYGPQPLPDCAPRTSRIGGYNASLAVSTMTKHRCSVTERRCQTGLQADPVRVHQVQSVGDGPIRCTQRYLSDEHHQGTVIHRREMLRNRNESDACKHAPKVSARICAAMNAKDMCLMLPNHDSPLFDDRCVVIAEARIRAGWVVEGPKVRCGNTRAQRERRCTQDVIGQEILFAGGHGDRRQTQHKTKNLCRRHATDRRRDCHVQSTRYSLCRQWSRKDANDRANRLDPRRFTCRMDQSNKLQLESRAKLLGAAQMTESLSVSMGKNGHIDMRMVITNPFVQKSMDRNRSDSHDG